MIIGSSDHFNVGPYKVTEMIYRDGAVAVYHGVAEGKLHSLLYFLFNDAEPDRDDSLNEFFVPVTGHIDFKSVRRGKARACRRVLPLVGIGRSSDCLVLAYPYQHVVPLSVKLKNSPGTSRLSALQFTLDAGEALYYLHKVGLINTDVHLANVFVDLNGRVCLGFNRGIGIEAYNKYYKSHPVIKHYDVVAPEQIWGNGPTRMTDIFQLAALFTTLLTGRRLCVPDGVRKMTFQAALNGLYPPEDFYQGLHGAIEPVIRKALTADPPARHENIRGFLKDLDLLVNTLRITGAVSDVIIFTAEAEETLPGLSAIEGRTMEELSRANDRCDATPSKDDWRSTGHASNKAMVLDVTATTRSRFTLLIILSAVFLLISGRFLLLSWFTRQDREAPLPSRFAISKKIVQGSSPVNTSRPGSSKNVEPSGKTPEADRGLAFYLKGLMPAIREAASSPTTVSNYRARKAMLQQCFLRLPSDKRRNVIESSIFNKLFELNTRDSAKAFALLDKTFARLVIAVEPAE